MRKRVRQSGVTINAVAGNHVVMLGLNIENSLRRGLRGFAIRRTDVAAEETFWMKGQKTFASIEPTPAAGEQFSSREHPFQSFQWSDTAPSRIRNKKSSPSMASRARSKSGTPPPSR